jgi:hypothetical protein
MKRSLLLFVAACSVFAALGVCAQTEQRIGVIIEGQMDAANRIGYEHLT